MLSITIDDRPRLIGYARVSTDKQADHGVSLDTQRAKIEGYAALYDVWLTGIEVDAGRSASSLERPALSRVLEALDDERADGVIVYKLDRLTRSVRDLGDLVDRYFGNGRCALVSVSESLDTRTAAGRLVLHILGAVSQWEREAIGERTAAAMAYKRDRGEYTGGAPPYGWSYCPTARALVPCESERAVMTAAWNLRSLGLSLREVGAALTRAGALPRSGGEWHPKTVRALLTPIAAPSTSPASTSRPS